MIDDDHPGQSPGIYTGDDHHFSMDDFVLAGALGLIGLYLAAVIVLFAMFSLARLIYRSFVAGNPGVAFIGVVGILIILSMYMAIGFWLQKTDRI